MTTLNEKAREYAKNAKCPTYEDLTLLHRPEHAYNTTQYHQTGLYNGYIAGAAEALRWRDVNVELPPYYKPVNVIFNHKSKYEETYCEDYATCWLAVGDNGDYLWTINNTNELIPNNLILKWRPIETI